MSVAYQHRSFSVESPYAPVDPHEPDDADQDMNKYINTEANVDDMADLAAATYEPHHQHHDAPSPFKMSDSPPIAALDLGPPNVDPSNVPIREHQPSPSPLLDAHTPRSKPVDKPTRVVTKNRAGMYECQWPECKEDLRLFTRKCEWSKHMDKHERPYVCTVKGCEKIQGFTYSGGLLRHEREVHGKHGGPKKALNCPHANCKRHSGKGFSRLENLQEHLRRVHTTTATAAAHARSPVSDNASDVASAAFAVMSGMGRASPGMDSPGSGSGGRGRGGGFGEGAAAAGGYKRKRSLDDEGREDGIRAALDENVTLRQENEELKRQVQDLRTQLDSFQAQVDAVQAAISGLAMPAPPGM